MDTQGILDKIASDARDSAASILKDAQTRADGLRAASESRIDALKSQTMQRAQRDGQEMAQRMGRMAELEEKKALLTVKRQVMGEAFDEALRRLRGMDKAKKRQFFLNQAVKAAKGDETLDIGGDQKDWYDDGFIPALNAALKALGRQAAIRAGGTAPGCGFVLRTGDSAVNCTFDALLAGERVELEAAVAGELFPE